VEVAEPQLSYRGRTLVINNLGASAPWHKLACMPPPKGLIQKLQAILTLFLGQAALGPSACTLFTKRRGGGGRGWCTLTAG